MSSVGAAVPPKVTSGPTSLDWPNRKRRTLTRFAAENDVQRFGAFRGTECIEDALREERSVLDPYLNGKPAILFDKNTPESVAQPVCAENR